MLQHPHPHPRQTQVTVGSYLQEFIFLDPRMSCIYVLHLLGHFFCCGVKHKINNQSACIYRVSAPISEINTIPHVQMMKKKTNNLINNNNNKETYKKKKQQTN